MPQNYRVSSRQKSIIERFLVHQIEVSEPYVDARMKVVSSAIRQWEALTTKKTYPWPGASNLRAPIEAIVRDSISARMLNALQATDRDINVQPLMDKDLPIPDPRDPKRPISWRSVGEILESYYCIEASEDGAFDFRQFQTDLVGESTLTGTGISKWYWHRESYRDNIGGPDILSEGNIRAEVIKVENFVFTPGYSTLERIPFVGEKYKLRPSEMIQNIDALGWTRAEVLGYLDKHGKDNAEPNETDVVQAETQGEPSLMYTHKEQNICDAWVRIAFGPKEEGEDFGTRGKEVRLFVQFAYDDPSFIFRVSPWLYDHGNTPYPQPAPYIQRRDSMLGMGICERAKMLATGLTTVLNQIVDGSTLANVPVFSVNENVRGLRNLTSVYPGKLIHRGDDPNNFKPEKLGAIGPDIFQAFTILRTLIEQLTKVSDFNLGRESSVTGKSGTATMGLALMAESGQYFDNINRGHRKHMNGGLNRWQALVVQNAPIRRIRSLLGREEAEIIRAVLRLPVRAVADRLRVKVAFSNTAASRELSRQEEMAKWQILQAYYTLLIEMSKLLLENPALKPLLDEIALSADLKMRALLETFGEDFSTNKLPMWNEFSEYAMAVHAQEQQQVQVQQQQMMAAQMQAEQEAKDKENQTKVLIEAGRAEQKEFDRESREEITELQEETKRLKILVDAIGEDAKAEAEANQNAEVENEESE